MYLQIEIEEKVRPFFRNRWRNYETDHEPDKCEFTRVVFVKTRHRWNLSLFPSPTSRSLPTRSKNSHQVYLHGQLYWQRRRWSNNLEVVQRIARIVGNSRYSSSKLDDKLHTSCTSHPRRSSSIPDPDKWWSTSYQDTGVFRSSKEDVSDVWVLNVSSELQNTKWNVLRRVASIFDPLKISVTTFHYRKRTSSNALVQRLRMGRWNEDKTTTKIIAWLDQLSAIFQVRVPPCRHAVSKSRVPHLVLQTIPLNPSKRPE